jgi:hypothetical protein
MRLKVMLATVAALAVAVTSPMLASGATVNAGALWGGSSTGSATTAEDCGFSGGPRSVDTNQFCVIDDFGAVELGVRFTSKRPMLITGVRVYRVDAGTVTGSLWSEAGVLLATGTFEPQAGDAWQDLQFTSPVSILSNQTYVVSYSAPNADYAFEWNYFTSRSWTSGPITAMQSTQAQGNGVFCYVGSDCDPFPTNTFRDTNYWVSPLWPSYGFTGFFQPVDMDKLNTAKAGSAIPVKFGLGGDKGLGVLNSGFPKVTKMACDTSQPTDEIETTVAAGTSSFTYDASAGQYVYVWKTDKAAAGSCYRFDLGLVDGSDHSFQVKLLK